MPDKYLSLNGLSYLWGKVTSYVDGVASSLAPKADYVAKAGDSMTGDLTTSADVKFTAKSKGVYGLDKGSNSYPYIRDNGTNMWIGALATAAQHHQGGVYISAGYDTANSKGYDTIHVCVPNAANTNGTNYDVYHSGNLVTPTDSVAGIVKLNSSQSIGVNANGQLTVGGRMGQFPTTTGIYAPNDRDPRMVGNYCLLVTDVKGLSVSNSRAFAIVSGFGITCKSAPAGTTEYHVVNNYANRIQCKILENGYAAKDEASSTVETIPVVSVTINGAAYTPDSAPDDPSNDIIITTERTLNPDSETTTIRAVGSIGAYSSAHIGNGIASENGGRHLLLGGAITKTGSSNDDCVVGQGHYVSGNGNGVFGRYHIVTKNRGLLAGTGHDTTNARGEGVSALGQYSLLDGNTLFAVGNGTSHTNRANAFEVNVKNGGTAKVNFIEANNGKLEFASSQDIAPEVNAGNWGLGTGGSIVDYDGTPGFATTDVKGTAVSITAATGVVRPVTAGETLQWSFQARKKTGSETGKLQLNLLKCNATGGSTSNNVVHDGTAASYTTEWVTYSGTFTVPSGMKYVRPRFARTNTGAGSAGGYEIKGFTLIQAVDSGIVLRSPNGTRYKIAVDDSGNLSTTAV